MTVINACAFEHCDRKATTIALALEKVNKILRKDLEEDDELSGVDDILECLANEVWSLKNELERFKYWAEDTNINVIHSRHFGDQTRITELGQPKDQKKEALA